MPVEPQTQPHSRSLSLSHGCNVLNPRGTMSNYRNQGWESGVPLPNSWVGFRRRPTYYLRTDLWRAKTKRGSSQITYSVRTVHPVSESETPKREIPLGPPNVVSRTRAENQMETCGVHLGGTLFLPVQGRTPRVPVKAAKGSCA